MHRMHIKKNDSFTRSDKTYIHLNCPIHQLILSRIKLTKWFVTDVSKMFFRPFFLNYRGDGVQWRCFVLKTFFNPQILKAQNLEILSDLKGFIRVYHKI